MVCWSCIRNRLIHAIILLIIDFFASLLLVIGGILAPIERKEAGRAYATEAHMRENGQYNNGAYNLTDQNKYNGAQETSYARA
jgi:hypothetical protein